MRPAYEKILSAVLLFGLASCGMVECDAAKKESIEHSNKGVEQVKQQATNEAIKEFERAIQLDPENHEAAYNLGQVYMSQADGACRSKNDKDCTELWGKAGDAFAQAAKNSPDDAMYHYRAGQALFEAKKYDQSRVELESALKLNKKLFKAYWFLGRVHEAQARPKDAAIAWTESAKLNPGFGRAFVNLGKLYYQWDLFPEAIKVLEAGAATAKDADDRAAINYQLGLCYDSQQQWDKSVAAYEKSLTDAPGNLDTKLQLGFAYANKGDKVKARKYLEEYTKSAGKDANAAKMTAASGAIGKLMMSNDPPPGGAPPAPAPAMPPRHK